MTAVFELESFERLVASPGTVLLRVAGRWRAETDQRLPDPILRVGDRLLSALPGPTPLRAGPDAPSWTATYSAPADLRESAYALEVGPQLVALPQPAARGEVPADVPPADPSALQERAAEVAAMAREALREVAPLRDRIDALESALADRDEEIEELAGRLHEAERAQSRETASRRLAEEEVDTLARKLEEAELARDHLRSAAHEAGAAARETAAEADRVRGELESVTAERDALRSELDAAGAGRGEADDLRARIEDLTADRDGLREELEELRAERDKLRASETDLRNELTVTTVERDRLREELATAADEAEAAAPGPSAEELDAATAARDAATAERDRLREELDVATAERDRLREQLDAASAERASTGPADASASTESGASKRERALVVTLFVVALLAAVALVVLQLTDVLNVV